MYRIIEIFGLLVFAAVFVTSLTPVYQCDNGVPLPSKVQVNDCESLPCPFRQGTTVVMNATFKAGMYFEKLEPEAIAFALGAEVNYPLSERDGCKVLLNTRCPIEEGEITVYQLQMDVLKIFPKIPLSLQFSLYGDGSPLVCFMIDAQVV